MTLTQNTSKFWDWPDTRAVAGMSTSTHTADVSTRRFTSYWSSKAGARAQQAMEETFNPDIMVE